MCHCSMGYKVSSHPSPLARSQPGMQSWSAGIPCRPLFDKAKQGLVNEHCHGTCRRRHQPEHAHAGLALPRRSEHQIPASVRLPLQVLPPPSTGTCKYSVGGCQASMGPVGMDGPGKSHGNHAEPKNPECCVTLGSSRWLKRDHQKKVPKQRFKD